MLKTVVLLDIFCGIFFYIYFDSLSENRYCREAEK